MNMEYIADSSKIPKRFKKNKKYVAPRHAAGQKYYRDMNNVIYADSSYNQSKGTNERKAEYRNDELFNNIILKLQKLKVDGEAIMSKWGKPLDANDIKYVKQVGDNYRAMGDMLIHFANQSEAGDAQYETFKKFKLDSKPLIPTNAITTEMNPLDSPIRDEYSVQYI